MIDGDIGRTLGRFLQETAKNGVTVRMNGLIKPS